MFNLRDKVAIITGGASGIGLASANRLAAAGAKVIIADLQDGTQKAAKLGGEYVQLDASNQQAFALVVNESTARHGHLDILVNCVGGGTPPGTIDDIGEHEMLFDFRLNCMTTFYGMQAASRVMREGGCIVNIASVAGLKGTYMLGAYNAAKAAVVNLSRTAALEYGPRGIRVNTICPGVIDTPMAAEEDVQYIVELSRKLSPLKRNGLPEEIAAAVHFLSSNDCGYITGQALVVDGGGQAGMSLGMAETFLPEAS